MRTRNIIAAAAVVAVLPLSCAVSGASAADVMASAADAAIKTAYYAAGVPFDNAVSVEVVSDDRTEAATEEVSTDVTTAVDGLIQDTQESEAAAETVEAQQTSEDTGEDNKAQVISLNITEFDEGLDYTAEGNRSGSILRRTYGRYTSGDYLTLASGAQVRNCTTDSNESLIEASGHMPSLDIHCDVAEPQVLIIHTHATESFEPYTRDYFDTEFPFRTRDSSRNMVAVGAVLAQTLADNGISVVHDGTLHDYPAYTGAYDRSEETIRAILAEYPTIKVVIDLHRDAITEADGSRVAPVAEIDGKNAAQFMIIAGCDNEYFDMPYYIENFKLAALLQNSAEVMYPGLARAVLFDYRNYNQHITTGSLLVEVGSHANSLDEALYTAQLLGESMAAALRSLE